MKILDYCFSSEQQVKKKEEERITNTEQKSILTYFLYSVFLLLLKIMKFSTLKINLQESNSIYFYTKKKCKKNIYFEIVNFFFKYQFFF